MYVIYKKNYKINNDNKLQSKTHKSKLITWYSLQHDEFKDNEETP